MKAVFKVLAVIFAALFVYAIYVQTNDPDPMLWYAIYGVAAIASILFILNKLPFGAAVLLFLAYIVGCALFWPAQYEGITVGEGDIKNIEEGREALGLLITAGIMLVYAFGVKTSKKA